MTDVTKALESLSIKGWLLDGDPTTEAEFNKCFEKITGAKDGVSILSQDPKDFGVNWKQVSDKMKELEAAEPMRLLREERDKRLTETDWWVLPDRNPTDAQKKYRQDLRDITKTATSLDDVTWPTKP